MITAYRILASLLPYVIGFLLVLWAVTGFRWQLFVIALFLVAVLTLHLWSGRKQTERMLRDAGQVAINKSRIVSGWSHVLPVKTGWYWYRTTWNGKQEEPELIRCEMSQTQSGVPEFVTAGAVNLFPEDLTRMNAEFWSEPVESPSSH